MIQFINHNSEFKILRTKFPNVLQGLIFDYLKNGNGECEYCQYFYFPALERIRKLDNLGRKFTWAEGKQFKRPDKTNKFETLKIRYFNYSQLSFLKKKYSNKLLNLLENIRQRDIWNKDGFLLIDHKNFNFQCKYLIPTSWFIRFIYHNHNLNHLSLQIFHKHSLECLTDFNQMSHHLTLSFPGQSTITLNKWLFD